MTASDKGKQSISTPVDETQIDPQGTSDQKVDCRKKTNSFDLISLAKLSTKILFIVFSLVLFTLVFLLYLNDQETQEKLIASVDNTVSERAFALDAEIYSITKHIRSMKSIVDRRLAKSLDSVILQNNIVEIEKAVVYHQKGDYSHLEKGTTIGSNEVLGSIIVSGKYNDQQLSRLQWILLGLDLFDSQEAEHNNSKNITLSYFGSQKDRFISTYPAIDIEEILSEQEGNAAKWFDHVFEVYDPFVSRDNNPKREFFWTQPYLDRAGNGMMVSCAIPVDEPSGVAGILGADIILNFINRFTIPIATLPGEMILVSPNREVISASSLSYDTEHDIALLDTFFESKSDELMEFNKQPEISNRQDEILFTYTLKNAPWTLLYLVPKTSLNARMFSARARGSLIVLMVMLVFGGGYVYLSKRFMLPGIKAISERNKAEQALLESEERLELAMTVANDGIWDWHMENDDVFFDSRYYTMAGYTPNEFPSRFEQWQQRVHPDDLQQALSATQKHLTGEIDTYAVEFRFRRKQGDYMWIQARGKIVSRDETGKPLRFVGTHSDITQRKEADERLEEAVTIAKVMSQKAETANRAKSEFLANMAHELRTPLNVILGFSRLLERGTSVTADQLEKLELIHRSGDHLLALINDILDISKIESRQAVATPDNFDLTTFLDGVAMMFEQRAAEKSLRFSFEKDENIPKFIRTDKRKLRQILFNLLSNAITYTKHGSVTLQVTRVDRPSSESLLPEKQPIPEPPDLWLSFAIIDTGIGIDPSDIERIFKQFIQAGKDAPNIGGTGLGLSISQSFATIMGSVIQVTSNKGIGSTFWFDLPVKVASAANVKERLILKQPPIGLAANQPVYRVLVVEDHKESRLMLVQLLKMVGFEVQEAVNGKEGMALFQYFQPDLILMDINMPVMDGLTATEKIKGTKAGANIPIIALTAYAFEKEREEILAAGCDDCIAKPYDENVLFTMLSDHLNVQFDYGEKQEEEGQQQIASLDKPASEALARLPKSLQIELRAAAAELNQQRTMDCIAQIRIKNKTLADSLETLTKKFMFEKLMEYIDTMKNG